MHAYRTLWSGCVLASSRCVLGFLLGVLLAGSAAAQSLASLGFTYQGQLRNAGGLVSGPCDLQFSLWDAADLGNLIDAGTGARRQLQKFANSSSLTELVRHLCAESII